MPKEIKQQIDKLTKTIELLETQLKDTRSYRALFLPSLDAKDIQADLAKNRIELAKLYKSEHQIKEAMDQLEMAYKYYDDSNIKKYETLHEIEQQCIDILILQTEYSQALESSELYKTYLANLLIKLPLMKYSKYKKLTAQYLEEYIALFPNEEGLSKISYILENLDAHSFSESSTYKSILKLKAQLLCNMQDFKLTYEAYSEMVKHLELLKKSRPSSISYVSDEEIIAYLNLCSLGCIKSYPIKEEIQAIIEDTYQKKQTISPNFEVVFEKDIGKKESSLAKSALLYHCLKVIPPKWFPKHKIQQAQASQSFFQATSSQPAPPEEKKELRSEDKRLKRQRMLEEYREEAALAPEEPIIPEYEKIRGKITFDWEKYGVAGYKEEIKELVLRLFIPRALSPEQLKTLGIKTPRGGILYGPPGTGKTLMARTIANYFFDEENVVVVDGPALISKYVGQSAENLRNILDKAKSKPGVTQVVIIDEIDALFGSRDDPDNSAQQKAKADVIATALTYLDGVNVIDNLVIIGATNYPEDLDPALTRSGRLGVKIKIGLPNFENRLAILKLYISELQQENKVSKSLNIGLLAEESEGLSGAGIKSCIDDTVVAFGLSQVASFEQGNFKIGEISKIEPLDTEPFLISLKKALEANQATKPEHEILLLRPFSHFNQRLYEKVLDLRKMAATFAYSSPMLINVSGSLGSGTTSFALNLFPDSSDKLVYMKTGALVSLHSKEQEAYINDCFFKAIGNGKEGVLVIDDLEDIHSCTFKPNIALRNKLKMALPPGQTLKVILVSKNKDTVFTLFERQISCTASITMPLIKKTNEIIALIQALELKMDLNISNIEIRTPFTVNKLKSKLLSYAARPNASERTLHGFLNYLNANSDARDALNKHRLFNERLDGSSGTSPEIEGYSLNPSLEF